MVRGRIWLVVLPLLAVGSEAAHAVLNLFAPEAYQGAELFEATSSTRALLPMLVGIAAVLVLGGLVTLPTGGRRPRISRCAFATLPLVAFAIQEHVEYGIGHGGVDWTLVTHPAFAYGLALQIPFAVVAYIASRLLFVLTDVVAEHLVDRRRAQLEPSPFLPSCAPAVARSPSGRPSGDARSTRGPPRPMPV